MPARRLLVPLPFAAMLVAVACTPLIPAGQLVADVSQNRLAVEGKFQGNAVAVRGVVDNVGVNTSNAVKATRDIVGVHAEMSEVRRPTLFIVPEEGTDPGFVTCLFPPLKRFFREVGELRPGQSVVVSGYFAKTTSTRFGWQILLDQCIIESVLSDPPEEYRLRLGKDPELPPEEAGAHEI